jgi:tetratricopeptide (TPR) repeat protein
MKDMDEADLPYLKDAALYISREDWAHPDDVIQLLRALIDRASAVSPPTPATVTGLSECRLALARLVLETTDHTDEVRALINAIDVPSLVHEEPRRLNILKADLALATGDVAGARTQYETLTGEPSGPDVRSSIRRTAKISQARAFLDRKDFDAAEDSLREVAGQAPIEKMSPDWALTRLRAYQDENLRVAAYLWAKRLLPVITEGSRSELLFRLTDLAFAQGDNDLAHKTLSELLQKHPYSEEAAQAKEKWPGQR